ncbi:MAG: hypothetical protein V7644_1082 [Actinomycetota bacterium]
MAAADPSPAAVITCARGLLALPDAGDARSADGVEADEPGRVELAAEGGDQAVVVGVGRRPDEDGGARNGATIDKLHGLQTIVND